MRELDGSGEGGGDREEGFGYLGVGDEEEDGEEEDGEKGEGAETDGGFACLLPPVRPRLRAWSTRTEEEAVHCFFFFLL